MSRTLYRFELKKLLQRRTYWLALAVMVLVVLTNELFPVFTGNYAANQVRDHALSGTVLDDAFLNGIKSAENPRSYGPLYDFTVMAAQQQDISSLDADTMYAKRLAVIDDEMTKSKINDGEKQYWRTKDAQVAAPYTYTYDDAYTAFFDSVYF
ncbi:MAG TPA: hypothetical protein DDY98_05465, partial [Ruminococcaceae bacterium]|nr:hypothetical protein [Oscillospiraceae bacterium]